MNGSLVKQLNDLLEYLYDSRNGFRECASQVADVQLKNLFSELANQRENLISSLSSAIQALGGSPAQDGSLTAAFHRVFVDLKSLLTNGDKVTITKEVKRGETTMLDRYLEIEKQALPESIKELITQQKSIIEASLVQIENITQV